MSEFTDAFADALDAQEDTTGERKKARVGLVEGDALCGASRLDEILVAGGRAEAGGITVQMLASLFGGRDKAPTKGTPVQVEGQDLEVLAANYANGIFVITCGEFAAGEGN